ncbi:unnamed protein product [Sphagnum balticum]
MVEEKRRGAWGAGKSGQPCRPPWRSLSEGRLAAPLTTPVPHLPSTAARLPQATARFLPGRKILPIPFVSTPIVFSCQQGGRDLLSAAYSAVKDSMEYSLRQWTANIEGKHNPQVFCILCMEQSSHCPFCCVMRCQRASLVDGDAHHPA